MGGELSVVVDIDRTQSIFFSVVAVAEATSGRNTGQAEGIVYGVLVVIVKPSLGVVHGGGIDGGGGVIEMITYTRVSSRAGARKDR